jgi:H+/gluconate symporter-like permease
MRHAKDARPGPRVCRPEQTGPLKYKNNIFKPPKRLSRTNKTLILHKKGGAEAVQFLIEHFTFLGFEGQNWMLILIGVIAAFLFFVWKTHDRV